jgi:hypothetical protein
MKKIIALLTVITALLLSQQTQAKVWRINNTAGVVADFTSGTAALASASVLNDDTLHFEGSATAYGGFTLNKRVVIIGTGYFINGANSNTGLQTNVNSANFSGGVIVFDTTASGSTIMGLDNFFFGIGPNIGSAADNITLTRCNISGIGQYYGSTANTKMTGWKINKCYISSISFSGVNDVIQNWEVTNNIFTSSITMSSINNLNNLIRNNIFRSSVDIFSAYFSNNIIINTTFVATNVTVKNNICIGAAPANFAPFVGLNGNIANQTDLATFQGLTGNSFDGQWRLKAGSAALNAGETISTITPDCGAFGTADPYVLSGIPAIPTIYLLTVPASVASNATTMPITISTKSNN